MTDPSQSLPRRYEKRMEEARRRYQAACSFEESDRVPVMVDTGGPFFCSLAGYVFKDYYRNLDVQRRAQLEGLRWVRKNLDDDRLNYSLYTWLDMGALAEGIVFDCEIQLPDEEHLWLSPWIIPKLRTPEDLERLEVPEPKEVEKGLQRHLRRQFGEPLKADILGIHPPFSAAGSLMGTDRLYIYVYKYPDVLHKLLRKLLETYCLLVDYQDEQRGRQTEGIGLCDDHAGFLPERMYREFVLPYNGRIYERYGKNWRGLHMDSQCDHIAQILVNELKINSMDVSVSTDLAKVKPIFDGKVIMHGNFDGKLLAPGVSYEKIREAVDYCMRSAAPGGGYIFDTGGEGVYPGIDVNRLLFMVKYAKKAGKYPIREKPHPQSLR